MSTIFRTLQVNDWLWKKQTFFAFCEIDAIKFGTKIKTNFSEGEINLQMANIGVADVLLG